MIETKSSKCLWIDKWLDHHQKEDKCGIVKKDDAQTLDNKIMFNQSPSAIQAIFAMSIFKD